MIQSMVGERNQHCEADVRDMAHQSLGVRVASPIGLILLSKSTRRISFAVKLCVGQAWVSYYRHDLLRTEVGTLPVPGGLRQPSST